MEPICTSEKWYVFQRRRRVIALALVAACVLALAACQGGGAVEEPTIEPTEESTAAVDRIAFVSSTGDLFTVKPDGSDLQGLAGEVHRVGTAGSVLAQTLDVTNYYAWPTWSRDGSKIAASRVRATDSDIDLSLVVIDVETARARTVYTNELVAQIAPGAPHYLYWSPDNRHLAFLATAPGGLSLFILDSVGEKETVSPAIVPPIYYQWAADGDSLLVHHREDVKLVTQPSWDRPPSLVATPGNYRAPALSHDGRLFAYMDVAGGEGSLVVAPVDDPANGRSILDVGRRAAFIWSPGGEELAVADQVGSGNEIFERLRIVSSDGQEVQLIGEGPILAFFWSPQGDKLAWFVLDLEAQLFDAKIFDGSGGSGDGSRQLFKFRPSADSFTMLSFFDQYAHSHSPWSPDGTQLVVSGVRQGAAGGGNGTAPTDDKVFVLDVAGDEAPRSIASGTLAFWSWN